MSSKCEVGAALAEVDDVRERARRRGCTLSLQNGMREDADEAFDYAKAFDYAYEESGGEDRAPGKGRFNFVNGVVVTDEMPSRQHAVAAAFFIQEVAVWKARELPDPNVISLSTGAGLGPYDGRWFQEPDAAITPVAKPTGPAERHGHAWPNIIVEVVYSASLAETRNKARRWLGEDTDVQLVVVSKLPNRKAGEEDYFVELFHRGDADVEQINFTGVNGPDQVYLTFGKEAIQYGVPQLLRGDVADLRIDLYYLKEAIEGLGD